MEKKELRQNEEHEYVFTKEELQDYTLWVVDRTLHSQSYKKYLDGAILMFFSFIAFGFIHSYIISGPLTLPITIAFTLFCYYVSNQTAETIFNFLMKRKHKHDRRDSSSDRSDSGQTD